MDGRLRQYNYSDSMGLNLVNAIAEMLENDRNNKNSDLYNIGIKAITTKPLSSEMIDRTILLSHLKVANIYPSNLGTKSITYSMLHLVDLFFYYSRVDKEDLNDELIRIRDILIYYFINHSSIEGLSTEGIIIPSAEVKPVMQGKYLYHAIVLRMIIPVLYNFDRDERNRPKHKQFRT